VQSISCCFQLCHSTCVLPCTQAHHAFPHLQPSQIVVSLREWEGRAKPVGDVLNWAEAYNIHAEFGRDHMHRVIRSTCQLSTVPAVLGVGLAPTRARCPAGCRCAGCHASARIG
jgi:hypothetical protein